MILSRHNFSLLTIVVLLLFFSGCKRSPLGVILDINEISRSDQEVLGKRMLIHILTQTEEFELKPSSGVSNSRIYSFLQNQYNQVHHFIKLDRFSPEEDRWAPERDWLIRVIDNDEAFSFCLPGGDLFLSTGILKKIENEAQLYALMSLEVLAMDGRTQLERIATEFNSSDFMDIVELGESTTSEKGIPEIVQSLILLQYDPIQLKAIDKTTYDHICNSSGYSPKALGALSEVLAETQWLQGKGYTLRQSYIEELNDASCGALLEIGDFQTEVKDLL